MSEAREKFLEPIDNASKPATIAGLNFAVVVLFQNGSVLGGLALNPELAALLRSLLGIGGLLFLISAFAVFFFTIYPSRRGLWVTSSFSFLLGIVVTMVGLALTVVVLA
jgi:hypothetical protein